MIRSASALLKALAFCLLSITVGVAQAFVLLATKGPGAYVVPRWWHRQICRVFGLRVRISGSPYDGGQTLFVANHLSYLDIPAMGSQIKASFVAKQEVARWPVFGLLAKLQQSTFIDRSPRAARSGAAQVKEMIAQGKSVILFPEGTSSDGTTVLPFKTSLFSVLLGNDDDFDVVVQPITVLLENVKDNAERDRYAWYGDMEMPPHLWAFAKSRGADIHLVFHPPLQARDFGDRKTLAQACQTAIAQGLRSGAPCQPVLDSSGDRGTLASQQSRKAI